MKRALLIGINYKNKPYQLSGCDNDARNMKQFLSKYGYQDVKMITESSGTLPTRSNIMDSFEWLLEGEYCFFFYSGHGGQIKATDPEEVDGQDECIYPLNYEIDGVITDNEFRSQLVDRAGSHHHLFFLFDCCHSASILDQKWNYYINHGNPELLVNGRYSITPCISNCFSGSKDNQKSMDIKDGTQSKGILTSLFTQQYRRGITYVQLLKNINQQIVSKYQSIQSPCVSFGNDIMLNDPVDF